MASIKINNLQPAGFDLFSDSESYLNNLTEQELKNTNGGCIFPHTITITITITIF